MAGAALNKVVNYLRALTPPVDEQLTDGQLLDRFVAQQQAEAFALLVQRHGRMVLGVCVRVLHDRHDADDAFQATFLVLARKAAAIRNRASLASWLYGVAHRTALRARGGVARRRLLERQAARAEAVRDAEVYFEDLRPLLDSELDRLPEKYRAPLVLCYLEGKTNSQAAAQLGWTKGTVSGRLARARELLRLRLTRRGLALSTPVLAGFLKPSLVEATVTGSLLRQTTQAVMTCSLIQTAGASTATRLAEGVLHAMFLTKLKLVLLVTMTLTAVSAAGLWWCCQTQAAGPDQPVRRWTAPFVSATVGQAKKSDAELLQGTWTMVSLIDNGREIAQEKLQQDDLRLSFKGTKVAIAGGAELFAGDFTLDPKKEPRQIRMSIVDDKKKLTGIYKFEGDMLTLCLTDQADPPAKFSSEAGQNTGLMVLKRGGKEVRLDEVPVRKPGQLQAPLAQNNLRQFGVAMLMFHDKYATFPPPAGCDKNAKPLLSWRVLILPFIDQGALFNEFKLDEPWDSAHNLKLLPKMPTVFGPEQPNANEKYSTFYQVFRGPGSVFEGPGGMPVGGITDGLSNVLLVVEGAVPVPWTKPEDLPFDPKKDLPKLGGAIPGGFNALWADGSVTLHRGEIDVEMMRRAIQRADGQPLRSRTLTKVP